MADFESLTSEEIVLAEAQTTNLLSRTKEASLRCSAQLGIIDVIHQHGKPITLPDLLAALPTITPSKAPYLHRILRVLVHYGVLLVQEKTVDGDLAVYYSLTPAGLLLQGSRLFEILKMPDHFLVKAWASLGDWFQNDDPSPFATAHGESVWDYFSRQPTTAIGFNKTMAQDSKLVAKVLLDKWKLVFEGLTSLVDVGGGTGTLAIAIAKAFPKLECTVFDRPDVVANLQGCDNLKFIGGDIFDNIPPANALLLKWILHDWNDEDCVKILKNCKKAIPRREEGGKVIIIDMVMGYPRLEPEFAEAQISLDIAMMVTLGSKERNKNEWEKLFWEAGFSDYKITPAFGSRSLIELYP